MGSRYRISSSDNTEQQSKSGRVRSWLFGGWRSKTKGEVVGGSNSNNSISTKSSSGHKSSESNKAKVDIVNADEEVEREKHNMEDPSHEEDDEEDHYQVEEEAVDKEADHFIGKVKSRMAKERLISMKRFESMLNRGV
ncbi:hypothetical protein SUGI_0464770 [Cryptomeria japonica]|nr:hypothetical protein SUGI_0464770 [Cryptomeria japonica]